MDRGQRLRILIDLCSGQAIRAEPSSKIRTGGPDLLTTRLNPSRLIAFVFLVVFECFTGAQSKAAEETAADLQIVKGPYLQWPTRNSMTIMWETSLEASSRVTVFKTKRLHAHGRPPGHTPGLNSVADSGKLTSDDTFETIHEVIVDELLPGTDYNYRVFSRDRAGQVIESDEYSFRTAVDRDVPFSFGITSETGGSGQPQYNIPLFHEMSLLRPDFVLLAGDMVMNGPEYGDWDKFLFTPGRELFVNTPFYLCLGNHEMLTKDGKLADESPWFNRFMSYPPPERYYSFDYGNAHFTAIDSITTVDYRANEKGEISPVLRGGSDGLRPGSTQYDFLVNDLKSSMAVWKFVFFHYSPYVSADFEVDALRELCPVFEKYGVDFVVTSHTIVYERSHPIRSNQIDHDDGTIYLVAGGSGSYPQWLTPKRAWHTAMSRAVPHFVQFSIARNVLELKVFDYEGQLFDTLTLTK